MSDIHFIHPWWLLGLLPCALLWFVASGQRSAWHQIMEKPFARALIIGHQKRITRVLPWLCALGVFALSGPTWQRELPAALTPQSNLMVILQQDSAMYAQDLAPSVISGCRAKSCSSCRARPARILVWWCTTPARISPRR